jgi:pimeloyl-ACP methyl ester carboxylesterase
VHFVRAGAGAPAFVFVHGFACDHSDWTSQLEALSRTNEVLACDLRAHGATPGRPHECSIEHYGGDVAALLACLNLGAVVLVGHSMGCRVALEAARLDAERIAGVVLLDGSRLGGGDPEQAEAALAAVIDSAGYTGFAQGFFSQMFLRPSAESAAILERAMRLPEEVGRALLPRIARWDAAQLERTLSALRAPLMAIQATRMTADGKRVPMKADESSPWLELLRSRVPGARIEVLDGYGHFVQREAAEEVNRLLRSFAAAPRKP